MYLTLREAATLLQLTERAVRARIRAGTLAATKRNGRWLVPRGALPLDAAGRDALARKAAKVRQAVEAALPSAVARTSSERPWSLADQPAFRATTSLYALAADLPEPHSAEVQTGLAAAAKRLAEAHFLFLPREKAASVSMARVLLSHLLAGMYLQAGRGRVGHRLRGRARTRTHACGRDLRSADRTTRSTASAAREAR
jgi:hypothetical protein